MEKQKLQKILKTIDEDLKLGDVIGSGGFGVVYKLTGKYEGYVLKNVSLDAILKAIGGGTEVQKEYYRIFLKKQRAEAQLLKRLSYCPYIANVKDSYEYSLQHDGVVNGFIYIMEEYQCFNNYLNGQYINEGVIIQMAKDILKALIELEKKHIIHRDIKPDNIFIRWNEGKPRFVLGDFGAARELEYLNCIVTHIGTDVFLAPEIICGEAIVNYNSDIYSLGSTMFYVLSGGKTPYMYYRVKKTPDLPTKDSKLCQIILRAIQKDPHYRYQTAKDMLEDLEMISEYDVRGIPFNPSLYYAKRELLSGNIVEARAIALSQIVEADDLYHDPQALACARVFFYINLLIKQDFLEISSKEIKLLETMVKINDAVATYFYAVYQKKRGNIEKALLYFKKSADDGAEIGCYTYGRMLCQGYETIKKDIEKGISYLEVSAKKGYMPSIRYLKKIKEKYPSEYDPEKEIMRLLKFEVEDYEKNKLMYIIPFI